MDTRQLLQLLERWIRPLKHRIHLMVGRGVVRRVNELPDLQEIQAEVLKGEVRAGMERGSREHGLVIAVDDRRYRIHIAPGEVAIYNANGDRVHLMDTGQIQVHAETSVSLVTPEVYIQGNLHVGGDVEDRTVLGGGCSMETIRDTYDVHHHGNNNPPTPQMP